MRDILPNPLPSRRHVRKMLAAKECLDAWDGEEALDEDDEEMVLDGMALAEEFGMVKYGS